MHTNCIEMKLLFSNNRFKFITKLSNDHRHKNVKFRLHYRLTILIDCSTSALFLPDYLSAENLVTLY